MKRIQVFVKVRNDESAKEKDVIDSDTMEVNESADNIAFEEKNYNFKQVFEEEDTQERLYKESCVPVVKHCFNGYNGSIFVYGCSGTGKTYTMLGPDEAIQTFSKKDFIESESIEDKYEDNFGIIPRVFKDIFERMEQDKRSTNGGFKISLINVQYFEIYRETLYDLVKYSNSGMGTEGIAKNRLGEVEYIFKYQCSCGSMVPAL